MPLGQFTTETLVSRNKKCIFEHFIGSKNKKNLLIDIIFAMKKVSVDLFRAAPYMLMLVLHKGSTLTPILSRCQLHQYFMSSFFVQKVFCVALMCLQFGFVNFWRNDFGTKFAHKMLVKLATVVTGRHE